jgi:hypothetical protein
MEKILSSLTGVQKRESVVNKDENRRAEGAARQKFCRHGARVWPKRGGGDLKKPSRAAHADAAAAAEILSPAPALTRVLDAKIKANERHF